MADAELTDEELAAMMGERTIPSKSTREADIALAEKIFRENAPIAAEVVVAIMLNSDNERTKLAAARYVTDRVLGRIGDARPTTEDNPYDFISGILREPTAAERAEGRSVSRS